ncbi:hypothetical protein D3C87_1762570 [compost metagenome]
MWMIDPKRQRIEAMASRKPHIFRNRDMNEGYWQCLCRRQPGDPLYIGIGMSQIEAYSNAVGVAHG